MRYKNNLTLLIIITMGIFLSSCERKPPRHDFPPGLFFSKEMRPLGDAIYNDNAREVKRILTEQQLSPDTVNKFGQSLLLYALRVSSKSAVKTLLEMGANPNKQCDETELSSDFIYVTWPIYTAVYHSDLYYVKMLLKYGYNVNTGYPLHATINNAPYKNTIKLLKYFLEKGSNINAINDSHETPIHEALNCGDYESIEFLLDHGADVTIVDGRGWTPAYNLQRRIDGKKSKESRELYLSRIQPIIDRFEARGVTFPVPKPVIEGETYREKRNREEAERKAAKAAAPKDSASSGNRRVILD